MTESRGGCVVSRGNRRWSFAGCSFDEADWQLVVDGRRAALEAKPLELLRELLLRPGKTISKAELLDAVWPEVSVVEASLPTAIAKLRKALKDDQRGCRMIETVPRIGYRLAVPVSLEIAGPENEADPTTLARSEPSSAPGPNSIVHVSPGKKHGPSLRELTIGGCLAILLAVIAGILAPSENLRATEPTTALKTGPSFTQADIKRAIRTLDVSAIEKLVAEGWDPSLTDKEGNDALGALLNHCEWNRAHDRRQMLLAARTLIENGAPIDRRNVWGDTAYSIAKANRYCGPAHPVTQMLEAMCYGSAVGPKDLCLATYELNSAQRRQQGLPPKA